MMGLWRTVTFVKGLNGVWWHGRVLGNRYICDLAMIGLWPDLRHARCGYKVRITAWRFPVHGALELCFRNSEVIRVNGEYLDSPHIHWWLTGFQSRALGLRPWGKEQTRWLTIRRRQDGPNESAGDRVMVGGLPAPA